MANGTDIDKILKGMNTAIVMLPNLVDLIVHYKEVLNAGELTETDKIIMKENLDRLALPDWDNI